ncbi:ribonuclease J [Alteromonas sp. CYL-A6]|uniref:ribonuclease J n=1 Tax=Alteromonas nitratireducens TaxID=3390813 RepID=UPI0034B2C24A
MNMNLYGHDGHWLMVDCGVSFEEPLIPPYRREPTSPVGQTFRVVAPDPTFIASQKECLSGLVITHAHEDHVGAVPYLWPRLQCPVFTTRFTAEVLRRKLAQHGLLNKVPIIEVEPGAQHQIGPFAVKWLAITHSLPEPQALIVETPLGKVLHTADWKMDASPVTGDPFNATRYRELGKDNILALVGDSTNATKPGFSVSERNCYDGLLSTIRNKSGRVVVTCFGSNIARLISLARVAEKTGRYMALYGRSLQNMVGIARQQGIWPDSLTLIDPAHAGYLPANEVLAVVTGSQGEHRAALHRLAADTHPHLTLEASDTVIFSSIIIPGNEDAVARVTRMLSARGIAVIHSEQSTLPIHASGHPCAEEVRLMYEWVKPAIAIPVHGEPVHLQAHADIAKASGVKKHYTGLNGDLYRLTPQPSILRNKVRAGRLVVSAE